MTGAQPISIPNNQHNATTIFSAFLEVGKSVRGYGYRVPAGFDGYSGSRVPEKIVIGYPKGSGIQMSSQKLSCFENFERFNRLTINKNVKNSFKNHKTRRLI
jgi:hypothetical protein